MNKLSQIALSGLVLASLNACEDATSSTQEAVASSVQNSSINGSSIAKNSSALASSSAKADFATLSEAFKKSCEDRGFQYTVNDCAAKSGCAGTMLYENTLLEGKTSCMGANTCKGIKCMDGTM